MPLLMLASYSYYALPLLILYKFDVTAGNAYRPAQRLVADLRLYKCTKIGSRSSGPLFSAVGLWAGRMRRCI